MGIFDKLKTSTAIDRLSEERLYEQVAQELKSGKKREGIWVKAMAKSGGDLNKAESMYIEFRVQSIKDELAVFNAEKLAKEEYQEAARNLITKDECESLLTSKGYFLKKTLSSYMVVDGDEYFTKGWGEDKNIFFKSHQLYEVYKWAENAPKLT